MGNTICFTSYRFMSLGIDRYSNSDDTWHKLIYYNLVEYRMMPITPTNEESNSIGFRTYNPMNFEDSVNPYHFYNQNSNTHRNLVFI